MAIVSKADLRTAIDAVFASGTRITAEQARGQFHDWIDSLLDAESVVSGAGINVSRDAGVVTIAAGGAAAAVGIPSYVAAGGSQPSDAVLAANIVGLANSPPFPSLVYLLTPNDLDRAADDLELRINGDTSRVRPLVDFRGDALAARDLDPSALYEILATFAPSQQYRLTEPIPMRRQDFTLVVSWLHDTMNQPIVQSEFEASVDSLSATSMTGRVTVPAAPQTTGTRIIVFGVPMDAPDIGSIARASDEGGSVPSFNRWVFANGWEYMGAPYKWWSIGNSTAVYAGRNYDVTFFPYS